MTALATAATSANDNAAPHAAILGKAIAVALCTTAISMLERQRNVATPAPAKPGSDVRSADEVAAMLGLDRKTVYDYAARGVIPHRRIGKRMLFSASAITSWLGASIETCSKRSSNGDSR